MSLFNFRRKKEKSSECRCNCCVEKVIVNRLSDTVGIKVIGAGCKSCHTFYENTKQAVKSIGFEAEVEYITDMEKIAEYGIMTLPALVVDGKVVVMGKVLKAKEIEALLRKQGY